MNFVIFNFEHLFFKFIIINRCISNIIILINTLNVGTVNLSEKNMMFGFNMGGKHELLLNTLDYSKLLGSEILHYKHYSIYLDMLVLIFLFDMFCIILIFTSFVLIILPLISISFKLFNYFILFLLLVLTNGMKAQNNSSIVIYYILS
jgi:hypothetical protein